MSLQKKCLTASAIAHGLLVLLVVVGSAFIPQKPRIQGPEFELINIPLELVEDPNVISGVPDAGPPPTKQEADPAPVQQPVPPPVTPEPPPPKPQPEVKPVEPVKTPVLTAPKASSFDLSKTTTIKNSPPPKEQKEEPKFDLAQAKRQTIKTAPETRNNDTRTKQASKIAEVLESTRKTLQNTGSRVGISYSDIIGPGGKAQMSYDMAVAKIYELEFQRHPVAAGANEPAVIVAVTVRRDGTVLKEEIIKRSPRAQINRAVDQTLKNVNKVKPFPSEFTSDTRTIRINFNPDDSL